MPVEARVTGLKEFRKELAALGPAWAKELKDLNYRTAAKVVPTAQGIASTKMESAAAATLRTSKTVTGAQVRLGGRPFVLGAEFGAARGQPRPGKGWKGQTIRGWNQFRGWRGSGGDAGYFLWPAIRRHFDEGALDEYMDELMAIADRAYPD